MTEHVPFLVSWNITRRCNLRCPHCYLDSSELEGGPEGGLEGPDDVTTDEALGFIDEIASVNLTLTLSQNTLQVRA
jgi:MoaA/NifB/PqqE/SkfB family radical SAM enzyme